MLDKKDFDAVFEGLPEYISQMEELARFNMASHVYVHTNVERNWRNRRSRSKLKRMLLKHDVKFSKLGKRVERKRDVKIWLSNDYFFQFWRLAIALIILYHLFSIPLRVCFIPLLGNTTEQWIMLDIPLDLVFCFDL